MAKTDYERLAEDLGRFLPASEGDLLCYIIKANNEGGWLRVTAAENSLTGTFFYVERCVDFARYHGLGVHSIVCDGRAGIEFF